MEAGTGAGAKRMTYPAPCAHLQPAGYAPSPSAASILRHPFRSQYIELSAYLAQVPYGYMEEFLLERARYECRYTWPSTWEPPIGRGH